MILKQQKQISIFTKTTRLNIQVQIFQYYNNISVTSIQTIYEKVGFYYIRIKLVEKSNTSQIRHNTNGNSNTEDRYVITAFLQILNFNIN